MRWPIIVLVLISLAFISSCTSVNNQNNQGNPVPDNNNDIPILPSNPETIETPQTTEPSAPETIIPISENVNCHSFVDLKMYYDDTLRTNVVDITKYSFNSREAQNTYEFTIAGGLYSKGKYIIYCRQGFERNGEDSSLYYCDNAQLGESIMQVRSIKSDIGTKLEKKQAKLVFNSDGSFFETLC